jgi:ABC-type dipeptide/oligopeptide/nickel transport system permease subunit
MVGNAMSYMRVYWHLGVFPTLAIAITMLGFTFLGDGLRDAFDTSMER